jgi:hypothetical protein
MRRSEAEFRVAFFERARVLFVAGQAHLAEPTYEAFLEGLRGAIAYLPLPERVPFANLFLLPSRDEFDRFVGHITSTPTHASRVGQSRGQDIYLLSPAAYTTDAAPNWRGPDGQADLGTFRRLVAHETVHLVEEALSPREAMEVRPGWWSEGLAVRISNQHRLDADVRDHMRADLEAGGPPPLAGLRGGPVYTWAWAAVEFLRRSVGPERLVALVTDTADEDVLGALGVDPETFEPGWRSLAVEEATKIVS